MSVRCGNCRFADWRRSGRRGPGDCTYIVPVPNLPYAVTERTSFVFPGALRVAIWVTDGADCPTWEKKS